MVDASAIALLYSLNIPLTFNLPTSLKVKWDNLEYLLAELNYPTMKGKRPVPALSAFPLWNANQERYQNRSPQELCNTLFSMIEKGADLSSKKKQRPSRRRGRCVGPK